MLDILYKILEDSLIPVEFHDDLIHKFSSAIVIYLEDNPDKYLGEFFYAQLAQEIEIEITA